MPRPPLLQSLSRPLPLRPTWSPPLRLRWRCPAHSATPYPYTVDARDSEPRSSASKDTGRDKDVAKRKATRAPATKTSLRRVAVEAVRTSRGQGKSAATDSAADVKTVTAYCAAEQYKISTVAQILEGVGYSLDPSNTGLYPQVVHVQVPPSTSTQHNGNDRGSQPPGDIFIFPSGTIVAWDAEEEAVTNLITKGLVDATENAHFDRMETEDLEFVEDPSSSKSNIIGERIVLGTQQGEGSPGAESQTSRSEQHGEAGADDGDTSKANLVLAKIAFSSGLARSAKLAVLESALDNYFESTRSIPTILSHGKRVPFDRSFILRKTGELFSVRAQLNLYSELTDSLPDLFWDSRHELGLEDYFDRVGKALDVNIRIKTLNQRMDYANEIAAVLRERLSEKHGLLLEWLIIGLIAIEVGFEILRLWKEKSEREDPESLHSLTQRYLKKELGIENG